MADVGLAQALADLHGAILLANIDSGHCVLCGFPVDGENRHEPGCELDVARAVLARATGGDADEGR